MRKIIDEFSELPISRERKRQLRQIKRGLCVRCDKPLFTSDRCQEHAIELRERNRKRLGSRKRYRSLTYSQFREKAVEQRSVLSLLRNSDHLTD